MAEIKLLAAGRELPQPHAEEIRAPIHKRLVMHQRGHGVEAREPLARFRYNRSAFHRGVL
jgi:hypothetical protein